MILGLDLGTILAFVGAGIVLNLTPGPDVMFSVASGASGGPKVGVAAAFGVALGAIVHVALVSAGLGALIVAMPGVLLAIKLAGASYLLWLAWRTWNTASEETMSRGAGEMRAAIKRGFVTNLTNPKVVFFLLAFLPQFTRPDAGPVAAQMIVLGALFVVSGLVITGAYGAAAGFASGRLTSRQGVLHKVAAMVYVGLALRLFAGELPTKG